MYLFIIFFGIICILVSLFLIFKIKDRESRIYNDIIEKYSEIVEYSNELDEILNSLEILIKKSTDKEMENKNNNNINNNNDDDSVDAKEYTLLNKNKDNLSDKSFNNLFNEERKKYQIGENNKTIKNDNISDLEKNVYSLYNKGFSLNEIAKSLKRGIREIEIVLKVIKQKETNNIK